jgi:type II secretion system protein I
MTCLLLVRLHNPKGRVRGFTLIEVLCALCILSFALSALYAAMTTVLSQDGSIIEKTTGYWVAEEALMQIEQQWHQHHLMSVQEPHKVHRFLRQWQWKASVTPLGQGGLAKVVIEVHVHPGFNQESYRLERVVSRI